MQLQSLQRQNCKRSPIVLTSFFLPIFFFYVCFKLLLLLFLKLVNVSCFEKHAGSTLRHPSDNIFLENGKSLQDILKAGWHSSDGKSVNANHSASRNNVSGEVGNKDHNDSNSGFQHDSSCDFIDNTFKMQFWIREFWFCFNFFIVAESHHKHRFDFNASKGRQTLPPSQTRCFAMYFRVLLRLSDT